MSILRFTTTAPLAAAPGDERTISGLAVPWDKPATVSSGQRVVFKPGSLDATGPAPKLIFGHDLAQPLGLVTGREDSPEGMRFTAKVSRTMRGDELLTLAADSVIDSVSIGAEPIDWKMDGHTMIVSKARWVELSLVAEGAFPDAKIATVTAEPAADEADADADTPTNEEEDTTMDNVSEQIPEPVLASPPPAAVRMRQPAPILTAGEYLHAIYHQTDKLAEIRAAAMDTGDTEGVLPSPIVTPIFDGLAADRPLMTALGVRAMPSSGKVFTIPKIVQRPTVGVASENTPLSSQALQIDPVSLTKQVVGGFCQISEADADWTSPSAFDALIQQLARAYARETESLTATAVLNACSANETVSDWTDVEVVTASVWQARTTIVENTGYVPTHLLCSPDRVRDLAVLQGASGPVFPELAPSNAYGDVTTARMGGRAFGLILVESTALGNDHMIVCRPDGLAIFEQTKGTITATLASQLATEVAFRGYYASATLDDQLFIGVGNV